MKDEIELNEAGSTWEIISKLKKRYCGQKVSLFGYYSAINQFPVDKSRVFHLVKELTDRDFERLIKFYQHQHPARDMVLPRPKNDNPRNVKWVFANMVLMPNKTTAIFKLFEEEDNEKTLFTPLDILVMVPSEKERRRARSITKISNKVIPTF